MRKNRILYAVLAALTLWVAMMSSGLEPLSWQSMAYAHGVAVAVANIAPPKGPDLGRFKPNLTGAQKAPTAWKPTASTSVAPKASAPTKATTPASTRTPGEQKDMRTATTTTVLNKDGAWTVQSATVPVHYQDAQGNWQDIDTSVVADTSDAGFAYVNKANSWRIHFAKNAGAPYLIHGQVNGAEYVESITGAASVDAVVNGSQTVYPNIFPNVDAIYTVMHAHVEETFLLHNATVPASITLTYHVSGATVKQDAAGNIIFTNAKGAVVFVVGAPTMFEADAVGKALPTAAGSNQVAMTLSGKGPDYSVTLTPDAKWLANPSRTFPVALDPTQTYSWPDTYTTGTGGEMYGDTTVESNNPNTLFYNLTSDRVGNCSALPSGAYGNGTGYNRALLKFAAGNMQGQNSRVTSASLAMWQTSAYAGSTQLDAAEVKSGWDETTLDWNNQPTSVWIKGSATTNTSYNTWFNVDVSDLIYDWWQYNQTNYGIELKFDNENVACDFFNSDDAGSSIPVLTVNYVSDNQAPSAGLSISAKNTYKDANGNVYTNNPTVGMSPNWSDPSASTIWDSNWTSVNGVNTLGFTAPNYTLASDGSQVTADTSTCGASNCAVETFFSSAVSAGSSPTFTSMFKWDGRGPFNFGVVSSTNSSSRWDVWAPAGSTAFSWAEMSYSGSPNSFSTNGVNIPFLPNTWYYGQVDFPRADVGEIYIWQVGQPRPPTPSLSWTGLGVSNPGLNFWEQGTNGSGTHSYTISNVTISQANGGPNGYGVWGLDYSNDNSNWSCPSPATGTWCVAASNVPSWTLSGGDGAKVVYVRAVDNAGNISSTANPGVFSNTVNLDQTPPTSSITSPTAGREVRGVVTVSGTASDPSVNGVSSGLALVKLYMDGIYTGQALSGSSPSFTWDTTSVAPGPHVLSFVATDNLGNQSTSAGVTVDVANTGQSQYNTYAMRDLPDGTSAGANVANGDAVVTHSDLDIPGRGPDLAITRTYNGLAQINNLFGWGWTSELDEGLIANSDGSVTYRDPDGGLHVFLSNGAGGYTTSPGLYLTLTKNADGTFTLTSRDQSKTNFTSAGYIASVVDRHGNTQTITYSATTPTMPTTVTDASGRALSLTVSGGHITKIVDPGSRTFQYAYDSSNNLSTYTDPAGTVTQYSYDGSHHLTQITANYQAGVSADSQTNVTSTLKYDSANRLVKLVDPMGFDADFNYNAGPPGSLQTQVLQLQTTTSSATPFVTTPTSASAQYETTTYTLAADGSGAVTAIQEPAPGGQTQYQFDSNEQTIQVTQPGDATQPTKVTTYTYDANGNETSQIVDPTGLALKTSWVYDTSNNLTTETDPAGYVTQYNYDTANSLTGNVMSVVKNSTSVAPGPNNVTTSYTYDTYGEVTSETAPPTQTYPNGVVTQYTYDSYGDAKQTVKNYVSGAIPDSQTNVTASATYNSLGEKLTSTDEQSHITQYFYSTLGDVTRTVQNYDPSGYQDNQTNVTTTSVYDPFGRKVTETNPRGFVTLTQYDYDGRVTKVTQNYVSGGATDSQTNVATTTAYDAAGNATQATDAKGNVTITSYDADNHATEVVAKDSSGNQVSDKKTTYDVAGSVASAQVIDNAHNPTTSYIYDAAGRQSTQTDPPANPGSTTPNDPGLVSNVTTTTYDADGNATAQAVTNANVTGNVSHNTMTYDALGRTLTKVEQAGTNSAQTTSYTYDADGYQLSMTQPAASAPGGVTTTQLTYDALGRTLTSTQQAGTSSAQTTTNTYDVAGHTLTSSNAAGTTSDSYDAMGRVSTETKTNSASVTQSSTGNTYDYNGNVTQSSTSYANTASVVVKRSYDALDRLQTLDDGTRSYTYDVNGNVTHMGVLNPSNVNIVSGDYAYDGGNRLLSQTNTIGAVTPPQTHSYGYGYNAEGDRTTATVDGATTSYTYDQSHQLLTEANGTGASATTTATYTYDGYNNRSTLVTSAGKTSYAYDTSAHTELVSKTDPTGKVTAYTYDGSGNLTKQVYDSTGANQTTTYLYDGSNRLTTLTKPDGTQITFGYDPNGQRTSVTVTPPAGGGSATTVKDVYVQGHLANQTDGNGVLLATFTYDSNGTPVSVQVGADPSTAARYWYVYNGHGDVVELVDASGTLIATYSYDTWGNITNSTESFANGWTNPYRYDGRDGARYDASDGLYWLSVRAYDPSLGRFLSRDPLNRAPTVLVDQPYVYAGNNPISNVDPSGQRFFFRHAVPSRRLVPSWPRPDSQNDGVWHWNDGNKKHRDRYSAYMGPIENDTVRGWHFNLHIQRGGIDLANYHVYYVGKMCENDEYSYKWWFIDTNGSRIGESDFFGAAGNLGLPVASELAATEFAGRVANESNLLHTMFFNSIMGAPTSANPFEWLKDRATEVFLPEMLEKLAMKPPITNTSARL